MMMMVIGRWMVVAELEGAHISKRSNADDEGRRRDAEEKNNNSILNQ